MKKILLLCCVSLITFSFVSISYAKTFYLKDGTIVKGTIVKDNEEGITLKDATIISKNLNDLSQEYSLFAPTYFINKDEIEKTEESKELPPLEVTSKDDNMTKEEAMRETTAFFKEGTKELPNNPYSWVALGITYVDQGDFDKAIENFKKAIEIDDNLIDPHHRLAYVYLETGNKEGAKREYGKTLLLADEEIKKLGVRGNDFKMLKEFEEIKEECKLALNDLENSTNHLREKRTLGNNDAEARANIQYFTSASEFYKYRKGEYAKNINDLLVYSKSPFVIKLLDDREIGGFKYSIEFHPDGYKIIGTPLECGKSGSKIFIGETGEKRTEEECK